MTLPVETDVVVVGVGPVGAYLLLALIVAVAPVLSWAAFRVERPGGRQRSAEVERP
jgi:hypothetical protein